MSTCNGCTKPCDLRSGTLNVQPLKNDVVRVKVVGEFKWGTYKEFRVLEQDCFMNKAKVVEFDLSDIDDKSKIDSSALGMLLVLKGHLPNTKFTFINCSDYVNELFKVTNLQTMLDLSK